MIKTKMTSFRLSEDTILKLDKLMQFSKQQYGRFSISGMNKTEIVEEAIKQLYFSIINESQDADTVERISQIVSDEVNSLMNNLHKKIDEVLFLCIKNDLGNKVFYRSPSVLPSPKDRNEAIDIIVNEKSNWDDALEEYLRNKWKRESVHSHLKEGEF